MKSIKFTILFLVAAAAGLAGVYVLVFAQESQQRGALAAQIADKERAAAQMRQATAGVDEAQAKIAELSRAVEQVESRLAPEHDLDRTVKDIWQLADADSLQTQLVQPLAICQLGNCSEQPVELQLTGDFGPFYAFLLQLERMPRLLRVTHMELRRLPGENGAMAAQMSIGIFYRPSTGQPIETSQTSATAAANPP
ncbi:MAG TPA: type 4a pilus biogenesis protein PilO [Tepidisphaeraceae bacterium]|jgi:Tfp pilus assembly protein PilO|nr:type 4a pilus biogenesis protein PilO [Tepidisphaeraceae bacterium]